MTRAVAIAVLAANAAVGLAQTVPVTKYTVRSSTIMKSVGETAIGAMNDSSRWTQVVLQAAEKRGRMDVVDGYGQEFTKGDYVLFDSAGAIVVRPATKQFFEFGAFEMMDVPTLGDLGDALGDMPAIPKPTLKTTYSTDSLGAGGTIDGRPTQLWRLTESMSISFNLKEVPAGVELPTIETRTVTQIWLADAPALTRIPFGPEAAPQLPDSLLKQLSTESRAALQRMPKGKLIVRSRSAMTQSGGMFMPGWTAESVTEVAGIGQTTVASSAFVLPADYVEIAAPQPDGIPSRKPTVDHGAKWRAKRAP